MSILTLRHSDFQPVKYVAAEDISQCYVRLYQGIKHLLLGFKPVAHPHNMTGLYKLYLTATSKSSDQSTLEIKDCGT